ncbi:hypothetical protein [Cryptosporangium minutisporangium]|uniref:Uncharacterized protein n=1 Tax=Cryptosporangium minutisporangium TaxID=113569 RepID=A0ABP6T9R5_9ACTN
MAIRETGEGERRGNTPPTIPRWMLLLVAVETAVIIGQAAGILAAMSGRTGLEAVTVGFVVIGACIPLLLGVIGFLSEHNG